MTFFFQLVKIISGKHGVVKHQGDIGVTPVHPGDIGVTLVQPEDIGVAPVHPGDIGLTPVHHKDIDVTLTEFSSNPKPCKKIIQTPTPLQLVWFPPNTTFRIYLT